MSAIAQIAQSGTSFLATLLYSHTLSPNQFGTLAAYWVMWMLVLSMNRAVFGEQIIASSGSGKGSLGYGSFMTMWLAVLVTGTLITVQLTNSHYALPGIVYIILFTCADALRYYVLGEGAHNAKRDVALLKIEVIRVAIVASLLILTMNGISPKVMQWGAAATGTLLFIRFLRRPRLSFRAARQYISNRGTFEMLMFVQFTTLSASTQVLPLLAISAVGSAAFGHLRLTKSLLAPAITLGTALQPALIRGFATRTQEKTRQYFIRSLIIISAFAVALSAACYSGIYQFGSAFISMAYVEGVKALLLPTLAGMAAVVLGQPGGALIRVRRLGRVSFFGQAVGVCVSWVGVLIVLDQQSITAVAWAMAAGSWTTVISTYALLVASMRSHDPSR